MKCPVCATHAPPATILPSAATATRIVVCRFCSTLWSVNHGAVRTVADPQESSFLESLTECVEGDDYHLVA